MRIRNIWLAFKDQLPVSRLFRNIRKGHLLGLLHERSHLTHSGQPKISYGSKASADKAAKKMREKYGHWYSNYKCLHCDGYHVGKNRDHKLRHPDEDKWNA